MRHLVACVGTAVALFATSASAAVDPYAPFAAPLDFRLPNGLRIVAQRDTRQPLVAFVISYGVGTRDDPPGYEGLAHLVEHLTYEGSRHLAPLQMVRELEHAGALRWNGATGSDTTEYYSLLPARQLALPFWLESERLGFTLERFNESGLAHEKKILAREVLESAPSRVDLEFARALFPGDHPYRMSDRDTAHRAPLHGVQWFFQRAYRPDNATIVIVGDFDRMALEGLAKRYFGPIPNPPGSFRRTRPEPRSFEGRERVIVTEHFIPEPMLLMAWPAPLEGSPETETFWALMELLETRGMASIDEAVRGSNVVKSVRVMSDQREGNGLLIFEIPLPAETKPDAVELAVEAHLSRLRSALVPEDDVRRAREYLRMATLSALEDPLEHALQHLETLRSEGRPFRLGDRLARIDAVTAESVRALVRKYIDPRKRLSAWHRWPDDGVKLPATGTVVYEEGE